MKRAGELFSPEEKQRIEAAVAEAEERTAAEIVPVVATASGRYDRAEDLFGLVCAMTVLGIAWWLLQGVEAVQGEWTGRYQVALGFFPVAVLVLATFVGGAVAASYVPALRLPFIGRREMDEEVESAAAAAFQRLRLRRTSGACGLLVYVSLYEHRVRVLGDDVVAEKLTQAEWDDICRLAVDGLRAGRGADGLAAAIARAGQLLADKLPRQPGSRNELVNELQFVD